MTIVTVNFSCLEPHVQMAVRHDTKWFFRNSLLKCHSHPLSMQTIKQWLLLLPACSSQLSVPPRRMCASLPTSAGFCLMFLITLTFWTSLIHDIPVHLCVCLCVLFFMEVWDKYIHHQCHGGYMLLQNSTRLEHRFGKLIKTVHLQQR